VAWVFLSIGGVLGPVGVNVTNTVRHFREKRRLGYAELNRKLAELGRDIPPLGLRRIESGERKVDVDDLVALALALDVSPLALLLTTETSSVTPQGGIGTPSVIWACARGDAMLTDVGPERLLQFLQESHPLLNWSEFAEEIAKQVFHLGNDQ
jgi:transcriptional regulator with XRE-family HTH domain